MVFSHGPQQVILSTDTAAQLGAGVDELIRHVPVLRELFMKEIVGVLQQLVQATETLYQRWDGCLLLRSHFVEVAVNICRFLEPIMDNDTHLEMFMAQDGLTAYFTMVTHPLFVLSERESADTHALAAVFERDLRPRQKWAYREPLQKGYLDSFRRSLSTANQQLEEVLEVWRQSMTPVRERVKEWQGGTNLQCAQAIVIVDRLARFGNVNGFTSHAIFSISALAAAPRLELYDFVPLLEDCLRYAGKCSQAIDELPSVGDVAES